MTTKPKGTIIEQIYAKDGAAGVAFEGALFSFASQSIEGYNGGHWTTDVEKPALMCIRSDKRVKLTGRDNGSESKTDMRTATAAVFVLALNRAIWFYHEQGNDELARFFDKLWRKAQNAWQRGGKKAGLDFDAMYSFLD